MQILHDCHHEHLITSFVCCAAGQGRHYIDDDEEEDANVRGRGRNWVCVEKMLCTHFLEVYGFFGRGHLISQPQVHNSQTGTPPLYKGCEHSPPASEDITQALAPRSCCHGYC